MNIVVSGSGRWGSAMACYCSQIGHQTSLVCSRKSSYQFIVKHQYSSHLKNFILPPQIQLLPPQAALPPDTELIIFATPIPFFREQLQTIKEVKKEQILMSINKGIEQTTLLFATDILAEFFPQNTLAHLGGPCFPEGLLLAGKPAAETLACQNKKIGKMLQLELSSLWFRIYQSTDLKGTCFLGAVKNTFAIIAGVIESKKLGEEALAILITRGIYEIKKLCRVLQITEASLYGLSGLGDLALTCYAQASSQNKNFGIQIGTGKSTKQIRQEWGGKICEGYFTTKALFQLAQKHQIDTPLIEAVYLVLYKNLSIEETLQALLARPLKFED